MLEGRNIPNVAIQSTRISLMLLDSPIALAELIDHARTNAPFSADVRDVLIAKKLLGTGGIMPSTVKEIIIAMYDKDGNPQL